MLLALVISLVADGPPDPVRSEIYLANMLKHCQNVYFRGVINNLSARDGGSVMMGPLNILKSLDFIKIHGFGGI